MNKYLADAREDFISKANATSYEENIKLALTK